MHKDTDETKQHSSHWRSIVVAGIAIGMAAGYFIHSKKGKEFSEETKKAGLKLQKQLAKKFDTITNLTQEKYEEIVGDLVERYGETKELADQELKELRSYLLDQWEDIKRQLHEDEQEEK